MLPTKHAHAPAIPANVLPPPCRFLQYRSLTRLGVHNNWGSILQGGVEYEVNKKYDLFFDFKEVWLAVDAHGQLSGNVPMKARVKLNPSLVSMGIKFHFH